MKIKFKKIMSVIGAMFLVGSTVGIAAAVGSSFPTPFIKDNSIDTAFVYGTGSAASDLTAVNSINDYLKTFAKTTSDSSSKTSAGSDFSSAVSVSDEIELGSNSITDGSKLRTVLEDNKLSTLSDTYVNWDNGDGSDNYDVHEEILLTKEGSGDSGLKLVTNMNDLYDEDLKDYVVLQNDESLRYRLVFDDEVKFATDRSDADDLEVTILGKDYKITDFNGDFSSVTISSSNEVSKRVGESFTVGDVTLTVNDIYENSVEINGIMIKEFKTKTINGIEVYVDNIAYHSSIEGYTNKVVLNVGKDIKRTIDSGDEYLKGDDTWEWDLGKVGGKQYIGVRYALSNVDYDKDEMEENPISVGQSYIFPENYAALSFDSLTNVTYNDFELSFDNVHLYNNLVDLGSNNVAMLEGDKDDSITLKYGTTEVETNSVYFKYSADGVDVYFKDIDGDVNSDKKGRVQYTFTDELLNGTKIATLVVKDTELDVGLNKVNDTIVKLTLTNSDGVDISMPLNVKSNKFDHLGLTEEKSESEDIVNGINPIGNLDYDVMNNYGIIIKNPDHYADNDRVIISVPSEQVYATISIKGQGEEVISTNVTTSNETTVSFGSVIVKDSEIESVKDKNLVIVGGSCINTVAANILGGKACGSDFTLKTGVVQGKALIKSLVSPYNANKVAIVVAGYDAADTTRAANSIVSSGIDLSVGQTHTI